MFLKKNYSESIDLNQEKDEPSLIQEYHYHSIQKLPSLGELLSRGNKSIFFLL